MLTNEKTALHADTEKLKVNMEQVSAKLHDIIKRRARCVLQPPGPVVRRPRQPTGSSTATDPSTRRFTPVGREGPDEPGDDNQVEDLEELIELLVSIKGTAFGEMMFGGGKGDAWVGQAVQDVSGRQDDPEEIESPLTWENGGVDADDDGEGAKEPHHLQSIIYKGL